MTRAAEQSHPDRAVAGHAADAKLLRESGVHKLLITDRDGNCLAYLLAWDDFGYDPDTDTFVCRVDRDGRELMNIYTEGEVKTRPGTDMYVVTAPDVEEFPSGAPSGGGTRAS